ncbi:DnaJ domain-containing protein [Pontiellaceae bacterium B1224]|nr:DnaJ domain-containing protein [Pontiellaceae bacterium B1224]
MTDRENVEFHTKRISKLMSVAFQHFSRADDYARGGGFGGKTFKARSVQGAVNRGCSSLKEAFFNAEEAIKYCQGNEMELDRLCVAVGEYRDVAGYATFASFQVADVWDRAISKWYNELDEQCQNVIEYHNQRYEAIKADILAEEELRVAQDSNRRSLKQEQLNHHARVLGLSGKTTKTEVKNAYYRLAAEYHPDQIVHFRGKVKQAAKEEWEKISAAYAFMCKEYDIH